MGLRRRALVGVAIAAAVLGVPVVAIAGPLAVTSKGLGVASLPVTITTSSLTSVADTYTNQANPRSNTGTAPTMNVQSGLPSNRRSFVQFDLSGLPAGARVQSATLQLRMSNAPSASRTYEADRVLGAWTESGLTWNTMPEAAAATSTVVTGTTSGVNLTWDVTSDVQAFLAGTAPNNGWQVKDTTESSVPRRTGTFRTRQYSIAAQRPTLTVIYAT